MLNKRYSEIKQKGNTASTRAEFPFSLYSCKAWQKFKGIMKASFSGWLPREDAFFSLVLDIITANKGIPDSVFIANATVCCTHKSSGRFNGKMLDGWGYSINRRKTGYC